MRFIFKSIFKVAINYNDKVFKPISNTEKGETSNQTIFVYKQNGNISTFGYSVGRIKYGHSIGWVDNDGNIEMRYHGINDKDELMTGIRNSEPEILQNGKIRLLETLECISADKSKGKSIIEEQ